MQVGIVFPSYVDAWKDCEVAEDRGFSHAWFYDTQLLCSDVWATMALAAEHSSRIKLGTLVGKAGTGKTLLAIAAGLQKTTEDQLFQRCLVSRPIFPLGRDLGYLPGDLEEKHIYMLAGKGIKPLRKRAVET